MTIPATINSMHKHIDNDPYKWIDFEQLLKTHWSQLANEDEECQWIDLQMMNAPRFLEIRSTAAISKLVDFDYTDFVYWKRFEIIEFNIFGNGSSHELFMGHLYSLEMMLKNPKLKTFLDAESFLDKKFGRNSSEAAADAFITENFGFFKSSVSGYGKPCITIGEDYIMSDTERFAFKGIQLKRI